MYRHKNATDEDFNNIDQMFKRILAEDKWLCNNTQKNLESGVYINGPLHPDFECGPLYFQHLVKETLLEHRKDEQRQKEEIWPATPITVASASVEDMAFCTGLSCNSESQSINW